MAPGLHDAPSSRYLRHFARVAVLGWTGGDSRSVNNCPRVLPPMHCPNHWAQALPPCIAPTHCRQKLGPRARAGEK